MKAWKKAVSNAAKHVVKEDRLYDARARFRAATHSLLRSRPPLDRGEGVAPFFIVGSGRTGTTLLRRILQASDEVHIPPEIWAFKGAYYRFLLYSPVMIWGDLVQLITVHYVLNSGFSDDLKAKAFDIAEGAVALPKEQRSLAAILDHIYRYHGTDQGTSFQRWGDKTPLNSYCLDEINRVFEDARFIHLVRDGVDVVNSRLKYGLQPTLQAAAERWTSAVRAVHAFEARFPDRVIQVRYEDMVREPHDVIRNICTFIGVTFEPRMIETCDHVHEIKDVKDLRHHENVFGSVSTHRVGKGRERLDAATKGELQQLIGVDLVRLGYEPVS